jgi:hypothetical protein
MTPEPPPNEGVLEGVVSRHEAAPMGRNITFLGVGLMIGGGVDLVGTGGAIFIVGVLLTLVGAALWVRPKA